MGKTQEVEFMGKTQGRIYGEYFERLNLWVKLKRLNLCGNSRGRIYGENSG